MTFYFTYSILIFLFICIVCNSYPLPQKRRIDYPLDQDCHLCHAVVTESVKKIGSIVSVSNTHNVINSICKTSSFEGYELTPDEIRAICDQFVRDNRDTIEISVLKKQMNQYTESIDDHVCNNLKLCPNGWIKNKKMNIEDASYMEDEL